MTYKVPFNAGTGTRLKIGNDGRVSVSLPSSEDLFLEPAPTAAAVHSNPGFESETGGVPDDWDTFFASGTTTVDSDDSIVYSGERSCRVHIDAGGGSQVVMSDVFAVAGGDRLDFSTFAVATEGDPLIKLGVVSGESGTPALLDDDFDTNQNTAAAVPSDWAMFQRSADVPGGHEVARLFFAIDPSASEAVTVYLDLTASRLTASAALLTGWQALSYGTGWEDWGDSSVELPRCRREGDWVTVCGFVKRTSGAGATICALPEALWPARGLLRGGQVVNFVGDGVVTVSAAGVVSLTSGTYSNGESIALNIRYPVDQE